MFENTDCQVIVGATPLNNKAAMMFNRIIGFKQIAILEDSYLKDEKLQDQALFSLHKRSIK